MRVVDVAEAVHVIRDGSAVWFGGSGAGHGA